MNTIAPALPAAPASVAAPASWTCALVIDGWLRIPAGIADLDAFRRWAHSDEFPEKGRIAFLDGTLWIDLEKEELYSHNEVKLAVLSGIHPFVKDNRLGLYATDGMRLSNLRAKLSTIPDGSFTSYETLQSGRMLHVSDQSGRDVVELLGAPDMVLEVVSDSSVEKDTVILPVLYHRAGISEFWRIDARGELRFEILRHEPTGYVPTQLADGWWHSNVFSRDFRLDQGTTAFGRPDFTLLLREFNKSGVGQGEV